MAVDADDNVYVFCRGTHPVMVFDREGTFLDAWGGSGEPYFTFPHGISVGPDGSVYTVDSRDHTVRKFTADGRPLLVIGTPHLHAPPLSGQPFYRPAHAAVASNGDIYVADGHGNASMHCFSPDGQLRFSWGEKGDGPGQFNVVHGIFIDHADDDRLYVADRFNNRIQQFSRDGEYRGAWSDLSLPQSIWKGPDDLFYIAELSHRISVLSRDGTLVARWGDDTEVADADPGRGATQVATARSDDPVVGPRVRREPGPGLFSAPHGIAVDSQGSFYVAEAAESWAGLDRGGRSVQKFVRA